jgi:hypothetical protein
MGLEVARAIHDTVEGFSVRISVSSSPLVFHLAQSLRMLLLIYLFHIIIVDLRDVEITIYDFFCVSRTIIMLMN